MNRYSTDLFSVCSKGLKKETSSYILLLLGFCKLSKACF